MKVNLIKALSGVAAVGMALSLSGCFGVKSNESGFLSGCYLDHTTKQGIFGSQFEGKIAVGSQATLSLSCTNGDKVLVSARFDEGTVMSAKAVGDKVEITAMAAGEGTLYVELEDERSFSFDLEALAPTRVDFGAEELTMVVGATYSDALIAYAGDERLAGDVMVAQNDGPDAGIEVSQSAPGKASLKAISIGTHSVDLGLSSIDVDVIEQARVDLVLTPFGGEAQSGIFCNFQDTETRKAISAVPNLEMPVVETNDETICKAMPVDARDGDSIKLLGMCAIVEHVAEGEGDCEVTVRFGGTESTAVVAPETPSTL